MTRSQAIRRLREIAEARAGLAGEERALLELLDTEPVGNPAPRLISTKQAMRVARVNSESTLYRWAPDHGIGHKTTSGRMAFDEAKLRTFLRGEFGDDAANLANAPDVRLW